MHIFDRKIKLYWNIHKLSTNRTKIVCKYSHKIAKIVFRSFCKPGAKSDLCLLRCKPPLPLLLPQHRGLDDEVLMLVARVLHQVILSKNYIYNRMIFSEKFANCVPSLDCKQKIKFSPPFPSAAEARNVTTLWRFVLIIAQVNLFFDVTSDWQIYPNYIGNV